MTNTQNFPLIFGAIAQASTDIGLIGVGKNGTNSYQKFDYRSIDDIRAGMNKVLGKNGLSIIPQYEELERRIVKNAKGNLEYEITLAGSFNIYALDGSCVTSRVVVTNTGNDPSKLMGQTESYAYKTMCISVFAIPTEAADDLDSRDEQGMVKSFMPKAEVNSDGVEWKEANLSLGLPSLLVWATDMTGVNGEEIMEAVPTDKKGKKAKNFVADVRKRWENG